jgi:predicted flap endonuclease-1-like 5' DNA nuclease
MSSFPLLLRPSRLRRPLKRSLLFPSPPRRNRLPPLQLNRPQPRWPFPRPSNRPPLWSFPLQLRLSRQLRSSKRPPRLPRQSRQQPRPLPAPVALPAPAAPKPPAPARTAKAKSDDLTLIEGIGPKINSVLQAAGVHTFAQSAALKPKAIKTLITAGGIRIGDPATWPEQAPLAADGKWDKLKILQDKLQGGRRV